MNTIPNATDKYIVVFNDKSTKITDRFTLVSNFGDMLIEKGDKIYYKGNTYSFIATKIRLKK